MVTWRRHHMETLYTLLTFCEGNPLVTRGLSSHLDGHAEHWCLILSAWTSYWENRRLAGDCRRNYTHVTPLQSIFQYNNEMATACFMLTIGECICHFVSSHSLPYSGSRFNIKLPSCQQRKCQWVQIWYLWYILASVAYRYRDLNY